MVSMLASKTIPDIKINMLAFNSQSLGTNDLGNPLRGQQQSRCWQVPLEKSVLEDVQVVG